MWLKMKLGEYCQAASGCSIHIHNALLLWLFLLLLNIVSVHLLSDHIPFGWASWSSLAFKNTTFGFLRTETLDVVQLRLFSRRMFKFLQHKRRGHWFYLSDLGVHTCAFPFIKTMQPQLNCDNSASLKRKKNSAGFSVLQKQRCWMMSAQWGELSLLKVVCWCSLDSHITGDVNQFISGFCFSLGAFCFSPRVLSKSRNPKGLAWCSLHQGAVSHFRLDYGWQVKENKHCLYRRDTEENSSFFIAPI